MFEQALNQESFKLKTHVFWLRVVALVLFAVSGLLGFITLVDYACRSNPNRMDRGSLVGSSLHSRPDDNEFLVVLFYHPRCPCTLATARNLKRVATEFSHQTQIKAFSFCPEDSPESWIETNTTRLLRSIPDVEIALDREGQVCREFGVTTSGHILVYNRSGQCVFGGGITPYRGHEGECQATSEFLSSVNLANTKLAIWPVYGCQIVTNQRDFQNDQR